MAASSSKGVNIILYVLSGALLVFYAVTLFVSFHPHAEKGYSLFYIDHKLVNPVRPGQLSYVEGLVRPFNNIDDPDVRFYGYGQGWDAWDMRRTDEEYIGCSTDELDAYLYVTDLPDRDVTCDLELSSNTSSSLEVFVNDTKAEVTFEEGKYVRFTILKDACPDGFAEVRVALPDGELRAESIRFY